MRPEADSGKVTSRPVSNAILFLQVFAFATAVPFLLRLKLFRLGPLLEPRSSFMAPDKATVDRIVGYVETAIRRGGPLVRRGCLTRGLTRYYFFRRAGMDVSLCFGAGTAEKAFVGHCWLEKAGEPFLEPTDPRTRFTVMHRISGSHPPAQMPAAPAEP